MRTRSKCIALVASTLVGWSAMAQQPSPARPSNTSPQVAEMRAALADAKTVARKGPQTIDVKGLGKMQLPVGYVFVPEPQADRLMHAMGNYGSVERIGLIYDAANGTNNFSDVTIQRSGHVLDNDASELNADKLLNQIRDNTDKANQERRQKGIAPLDVDGWAQKPAYDAKTHRLAWAVDAHEEGASRHLLNFKTLMLGRDTTIALTTVAESDAAASGQAMGTELIAATEFNDGQRYGNFDRSTDKIAEYGLAALIVGVAAKKLGLIALAGVFLAKFAKVLLVGALAVSAAVKKFFKGKDGPRTPIA